MRSPARHVFWVAAAISAVVFAPDVRAQESWGRIQGTVTDVTGSVLPGTNVIATSRTLPRGLTTITDARGNYVFTTVPIGTFDLTFIASGFHTMRHENVAVGLGSQVTFNARLHVGAVAESIEVNESTTSLDPTSSKMVTNITAQQFERVPHGRNFHTVLMMSPGVRQEVKSGAAGVGGVQVDGASGSENAYYIDGVEVSDLMTGALRMQNSIPFEFVREVQIKTGGFEAEFGGATGGVINVATRGGSNEFHGEALMQATTDAFNAGDRGWYQRSPVNANLAEFYKPKEDQYRILYPGVSLGGPLVRDRLYGFVSYMPERETTTREVTYRERNRTFTQTRIRQYGLGRLDWSPRADLQLNTSWVWSPAKRIGALPPRDARVTAPATDMSQLGDFVPSQAFSATGNYSPNSRLLVSARYGYKYLNSKSNYNLPAVAHIVYRTPSSNADGVPDALRGNTGFQNIAGSFGVERDITARHNLYNDASYVTTIFGQQHILKAGYALNNVYNDISDGSPNGSFQIYWGDTFSRGSITNARGQYGYYVFEDGPRHNSRAQGRNHGMYVQDTWRAHPRVTLNLGVRFENEFLPPYTAEVNGVKVANPVQFGWMEKIAPRLGLAWDVRGDGRWKASASFGLFYDVMKYTLARASFGGEYWFSHVYRLDSTDLGLLGRSNPGALGSLISSRDNRSIPINERGELSGIDPNLRPFTSREFTLALDRKLSSHMEAGVRYTRKDLLRVIEDIGRLDENENEVYLIGNPGYGLTRDRSSIWGATTPDGQEFLYPKAKRQFDALEARVQGQFQNTGIVASYTYSRLYGNYAGLANSDEAGRSDPSISRSFDQPFYYFDSFGSQRNVYGRLATDRPHAFKLFGWFTQSSRLGLSTYGFTQVAMSGALDSTTVQYLTAPTFPMGRGDMGRMPVFTQSDLNFTHLVKMTERMDLKFEVNATNLLNQATVISRVTQINRAGTNITHDQLSPEAFFSGYDLRRIVSPKGPVQMNPLYGLPGGDPADGGAGYKAGRSDYSSAFLATNPGFGAYQGPRSFRFGVRLIF